MKFEHFAINVEDPPAVAAWYVEHLQMQLKVLRAYIPFEHRLFRRDNFRLGNKIHPLF